MTSAGYVLVHKCILFGSEKLPEVEHIIVHRLLQWRLRVIEGVKVKIGNTNLIQSIL